jgi:histidinol dehydrogenase
MAAIVEYDRLEAEGYGFILHRDVTFSREIEETVRDIISGVRDGGDSAVIKYTTEFDNVTLDRIEPVPVEKLHALHGQVDDEFLVALREAIGNVRAFHELQRPKGFSTVPAPGVTLEMQWQPLDSVGVYVPGGLVAYFSSVYMNVIPAQVAGVERIVTVTPPRFFDQSPAVAATLVELGVEEVYTIGGIQAVAALAYGTESIRRVDKIVGPGNQYVAEAKRQVFGPVDIDMFGGPSEIVVVGDDTADPAFVAADMLSQAEHGSGEEIAVLVTTSRDLAEQVDAELERQLDLLTRDEHARKVIARTPLVIVGDLDEAADLVNRIAPEHLELMTAEPRALLAKIRHAGAVFLGRYTPEPLSDYYSGTNHVLPTAGTARYASPLGVYDCGKWRSVAEYDRDAVRRVADTVDLLATREDFEAHARAVTIRKERD